MTPRSARTLATSFPIESFTLPNGLRVVAGPDRTSPTVTVAVVYDVGFRSEPEGKTGFAHLFEHLMFQGSRSLAKLELDRLIEGNGGVSNGQTRHDCTVYWETLPSNALEIALFGEADRMHELALTEENLQNQIDVVKEEIRVNVHNRPYGAFPWIHLPAVMFETFPNAHDGYGSFEDLEAATQQDAAGFFDRFYAPANAVLAVAGDIDTDELAVMLERHFGRVPKRPAPDRPDFGEPLPKSEKRRSHTDKQAPRPALALGYRVPHPVSAFGEYAATTVLAAVLGDGQASRLYRRLVKQDRLATHVSAYVGEFGDWLSTRDPTMLEIVVYYVDVGETDRIIAAIDEECAKIAEDITSDELERVTSSLASDFLQENDQLIYRTLNLAIFEQQRGSPALVNDIPTVVRAVTAQDVAEAAARWLDPKRRAVLEWRPGA